MTVAARGCSEPPGLTCGCAAGSEGRLWEDLLLGGGWGGVSKPGGGGGLGGGLRQRGCCRDEGLLHLGSRRGGLRLQGLRKKR